MRDNSREEPPATDKGKGKQRETSVGSPGRQPSAKESIKQLDTLARAPAGAVNSPIISQTGRAVTPVKESPTRTLAPPKSQ